MVLPSALFDDHASTTWLLRWHHPVDPAQRQTEYSRLAEFVNSGHVAAALPLHLLQGLTGRIPPQWSPELKALLDAARLDPVAWWSSSEAKAFAKAHDHVGDFHRPLAIAINLHPSEPLLASAISFWRPEDEANLDWVACVRLEDWTVILDPTRPIPAVLPVDALNAAAIRLVSSEHRALELAGDAIFQALSNRS